jgi:hypothetical protein
MANRTVILRYLSQRAQRAIDKAQQLGVFATYIRGAVMPIRAAH